MAAIAFTLPITAVNFQRVSLVAPLANLLAVPAFLLVAVTAALTCSTKPARCPPQLVARHSVKSMVDIIPINM